MFKKIISLVLVTALCLTMVVIPSYATSNLPSGSRFVKTKFYGDILVCNGTFPDNTMYASTPKIGSFIVPGGPASGESLFAEYRGFKVIKCYGNASSAAYSVRFSDAIDKSGQIAQFGNPSAGEECFIYGLVYDVTEKAFFMSLVLGSISWASFTWYEIDSNKIKSNLTADEMRALGDESFVPPPENSTAKFELLATTPVLNVVIDSATNNTNEIILDYTVELHDATVLENIFWNRLSPSKSLKCAISKVGTSTKTPVFNGSKDTFGNWVLSIFSILGNDRYTLKTGRTYTFTLYCRAGDNDFFGTSGDVRSVLDTITFTVDGEMEKTEEIPVGDTTYTPTPPKTPAKGDVNVVVNESGNITGVQQWNGNQWIIIEKIEINNTGGDSGGSSSSSTPDGGGGSSSSSTPDGGGGSSSSTPTDPDNPPKPDDGENIWDKLFGALIDFFGKLIEMLVGLVTKLLEGIIMLFDSLFAVIERILAFLTGGFTDFLKAFFYWCPPELVDAFTITVLLGVVLAVLKFFKGG